jgi:hypothetical protein
VVEERRSRRTRGSLYMLLDELATAILVRAMLSAVGRAISISLACVVGKGNFKNSDVRSRYLQFGKA